MFWLAPLLATVVLSQALVAQRIAGSDGDVEQTALAQQADPLVLRQRETLNLPYMHGTGRTSPSAKVQFGTHVSVQVNVEAGGNNIIGDAANEPSIAVDPTNPNRMAIGWRQFYNVASDFRQAGYAYSTDAGRHWTFPGVLEPGVFRSDPVLSASPDGVFYYCSLSAAVGLHNDLFISVDGGRTWPTRVWAGGGDKPWIAVDQSQGPGRANIYFDSAQGGGARSNNGGVSWWWMNPPFQWGTFAIGPGSELYVASDSGSAFQVARAVFIRS